MELQVTSLKGIEYEGEITSLNIKTTTGEITVLSNHRPMITVLAQGSAKVTDSQGKVIELVVRSGFLEVSPDNVVSILFD